MTAKKTTTKPATIRKQAPVGATTKRKRTTTRKKASAKAAPALPVEELPTEEIWQHYQDARNAGEQQQLERVRNVLMERHFPLVKYIAERLLQTLPKSIELDDLVSAGLFGLMDAIRGFDPSRGIKFKTYCTTRIRGSILDQLRSQDWVPRLVRLKASRIDKALQRLTGLYGREPTHSELARELEMDHKSYPPACSSGERRPSISTSSRAYSPADRKENFEGFEIRPIHRGLAVPVGIRSMDQPSRAAAPG